jgi:NADPH-dependent 2,4-dienoyl-CoA reductase/sulfur reductase-like enzyme
MKNTLVSKVIPRRKKVLFSDGESIGFDKLLIATGAKPVVPTVKGLDLKGVYVMGTLDAALLIKAHVRKGASHAVVVGGGFMGIETAVSLKKTGVDVTIVEMLPHILSRMLDTDVAERVAGLLEKHGIKLMLNNVVEGIDGKEEVTHVSLKRDVLRCDMVVFAMGVTPNVDVVKNSGISTNQGIKVDSTMQTNIKDIYAAGDVVEVKEQIQGRRGNYATWPNAVEQGRVAGLNMAGVYTPYVGAEVVNVLDVFDVPVVAMGYKSVEGCREISRDTPQGFRKILLKDDKIIGLQFIGTIWNTGVFYTFMKRKTDISDVEGRLLDDNYVVTP